MSIDLRSDDAADEQAPPAPPSPYRGLMAYTEADADLFFGREADIALITNNTRANRVTVLYGPSGVGKSSVLRAGVVRRIRDENRMRFERFGRVEVVVAHLKDWKDDPYDALGAAVREAFATTPGAAAAGPGSGTPTDLVDEILALRSASSVDLLLILDQFEEFFLYQRARGREFAEFLARLLERRTRVNVCIAMREDGLALLGAFEADIPAVFDNTLRLEHLDLASAEAAIRKPLDRYNQDVPEDRRVTIEDGLVRELLSQVRIGRVRVDSVHGSTVDRGDDESHGPHVARIEAPYLQLVLTRLWEVEAQSGSHVLRLATLERLHGAQEIVREHLNRVMRQFTPPEMAVLADAFGYLVTPSGTKIAHRASDLAGSTGHDQATMEDLLHRLTRGDHHILREIPPPMDDPDPKPRYEIFHDVLALAVLDWRRRYLTEVGTRQREAELLAENERVEKETRATRRRLRRARAVLALMALLLVICVAVGAWAWHSRGVARHERSEARSNAERAEANSALDEVNRLLTSDPAEALTKVQALRLDPAHDPDGRYQDAYRRALDAADTDVIVQLGSPALLADFVDDGFVAVTEDGHVRLWTVQGDDPMRLDPDPKLDVTVPNANASQVTQAFTAGHGGYVVVRTDVGGVSSVDLGTGEVRSPDAGFELGSDDSVTAADTGNRDDVLLWNYSGHGVVWDVAANTVASSHAFDERVIAADIAANGKRIAVIRWPSTYSFTAQVWGTNQDQLVDGTPVESHTDQTLSYVWPRFLRADGSQLAIGGSGWRAEMSLWDVGSGHLKPLGEAKHWRQIYDVADVYDANAKGEDAFDGLVAVAGDKHVDLFDAKGKDEGSLRTSTADFRDWATAVAVSPKNSTVFAVVSNEGYVDVYAQHLFMPAHPRWSFRGHSGRITSVAWSEDGQRLATASDDGTVRIWRMPRVSTTWYSTDWILAAKTTPDDTYEFGFTPGGYVIRTGPGTQFQDEFVSTYSQLVDMDPAPDGQRAVSIQELCYVPDETSFDKTASPAVTLTSPKAGVCPTAVGWNPDPAAHQIVAGTSDGQLVSWDADTGAVGKPVQIAAARATVQDLAYSADGKLLAVLMTGAQKEGTGTVFLLRADDLTQVDSWPASDLGSVDISDDGRYVVTAGNESHQVQVWDTQDTSQPVRVLTSAKGAGTLAGVALSHDDGTSRVAVATASGRIYIWDRASGRLMSVVLAHGDAADAVSFDRNDPSLLYSAGDDGESVSFTCDLCSMDTGDLRAEAKKREAQVVKVD